MIQLLVTCYKYAPGKKEFEYMIMFLTVTNSLYSIVGMGQTLQVLGTGFLTLHGSRHASFASVCPTEA